jgi:hypothetical protein
VVVYIDGSVGRLQHATKGGLIGLVGAGLAALDYRASG